MIQNINDKNDLGKILKQRRLIAKLTLDQLSITSGVSAAHLSRIERGERYPSAHILRKIAKPLGIAESGLFAFAGYLSHQLPNMVGSTNDRQLDPYVATVLSQEPPDIQRTVIGILAILKEITKAKK